MRTSTILALALGLTIGATPHPGFGQRYLGSTPSHLTMSHRGAFGSRRDQVMLEVPTPRANIVVGQPRPIRISEHLFPIGQRGGTEVHVPHETVFVGQPRPIPMSTWSRVYDRANGWNAPLVSPGVEHAE